LDHLKQIILTDSELNAEQLMEVDEPIEECSNHENRSIVQFYSKLITAAGIKSPLVRTNQVDYKVAEKLALQLKSKLLPFLRCASVFFHFLSDIKPPTALFNARPATTEPLSEFSMLCEYLGLPKKLSETFSNRWLVDLAQSWVNHPRLQLLFARISSVPDAEVPLCLIEQCHKLNRLVDLPDDFCELINEVSQFSCANSDSKDSKMPTMCLICGQVLCSQSFCCQQDLEGSKVGACVHHASVCGAGVGIFLRIRECRVLLISGKSKGCFIDAPYVDEYGETDTGLNRGNPLRLCSVLYDELNKLWLEHRIPEKIAHSLEQTPNLSNGHWQIF
jgi:E3 ubiquitin-protein ligase UBR2